MYARKLFARTLVISRLSVSCVTSTISHLIPMLDHSFHPPQQGPALLSSTCTVFAVETPHSTCGYSRVGSAQHPLACDLGGCRRSLRGEHR
jgi:hypothetical protein